MRGTRLTLLALTFVLAPALAFGADADEQTLKQAGYATDDASLLSFFRQRTPSAERLRDLVRQLGDDVFETREKATRELIAFGPAAEPFLREALKSSDPEVTRRADECLKAIGGGPSAAVIASAARLLARRKPADGAAVLLAYVPRVQGETAEDEVRAALAALAVRDGKPEPVLEKAMVDADPGLRGAAASALARGGAKDALPAVRKLLQDPEASVRLQVALALAPLKEKEAVPVLIDLLAVLPPAQLGNVEDLLFRLAEDRAPDATPTDASAESRRRYRDAWASWWKAEGDRIDLTRLDRAAAFRGFAMIVMLDEGRILEVDEAKKIRWQIDGLEFPLDAQLLPGERVLVAEHKGNRVTERNRKGEVLWEKKVEGPLMAQRLPGGNTLIATRFQLIEVDRNGKQVFTYFRPQGDMIMKAQKLRNGEIGIVTASRLFLRIDASGKELGSFTAPVETSGGRIDLLPGGRVLVPCRDLNKVIEYDMNGKVVWEVDFPEPVNAVRMPNGNTMITSFQAKRAVEVDASGKPVWEYASDVRVTRAWRR